MTSRGPLGYPDYQKVNNWDGPLLFSAKELLLSEGQEQGPWDMSRYASLLARLEILGTPIGVNLAWTTAQGALGGLTATRFFVLEPNILAPIQILIPNLGPSLKWTTTTEVGKTAKLTANVHGSNRVNPLGFVPRGPLVLSRRITFAKAETVTLYPSDYYGGPAQVYYEKEGQTLTFVVEAQVMPGEWVSTFLHETAAAKGNDTFSLLLPPTAWRLAVVSGGLQNFNVRVAPSYSGSS